MARVNAIGTEFVESDVDDIVRPTLLTNNWNKLRTRNIQAIALPKTTTPDHIEWLVSRIERLSPPHKLRGKEESIKIIAMIENAKGMINIEQIARAGEGYLDGLLVCPLIYHELTIVCSWRLFVWHKRAGLKDRLCGFGTNENSRTDWITLSPLEAGYYSQGFWPSGYWSCTSHLYNGVDDRYVWITKIKNHYERKVRRGIDWDSMGK